MGNSRFKLSDMFPNVWFYKLKDMNKSKHHEKKHHHPSSSKQEQPHFNPRKSYHFTRELVPIHVSPDQPLRKSTKKRNPRRNFRSPPSKVLTSSVSAGCSCRETIKNKPDSPPEYSASSSSSLSSSGDSSLPQESFDNLVWSSSKANDDIISDADVKKIDEFLPELELPPIVTKPAKFNDMVKDIKNKTKKFGHSPSGVKLRVNSPKIANRRLVQGHARRSISSNGSSSSSKRSLSESFAVVKSSVDPQRDFKESMVEMIMENNITASKDLEDLLACYLSLNSDEYHEIIIKVFKQIWFDLIDVR
ncbi:hypothetical protein ES319_A02G004300v1 [Gossypium barbadense]|uniref:Transcription repressor n=3 Tax=Gossypium TaxID=3633 RepID=A0A2P5XYZ1_GOSBA|nr:hypothetical protein ES319_A02G004300v1 [Gossypium barbadense]PPS08511.1 hypothetical protein GOBAR_AA12137 [Gossypium barbadense]TYH26639.1 hypothetical protein ES288_A02G004500v1 [Gossypium darwinii]TYI38138.1 hypothetical protein ES332_A02G004600v1 [Gossypium tomentosum]